MIKVNFVKFDNEYKAYITVGEKIFENEDKESIDNYINNVINTLQDIMNTAIDRIIYKSNDEGKTWYVPIVDKVGYYSNELELV